MGRGVVMRQQWPVSVDNRFRSLVMHRVCDCLSVWRDNIFLTERNMRKYMHETILHTFWSGRWKTKKGISYPTVSRKKIRSENRTSKTFVITILPLWVSYNYYFVSEYFPLQTSSPKQKQYSTTEQIKYLTLFVHFCKFRCRNIGNITYAYSSMTWNGDKPQWIYTKWRRLYKKLRSGFGLYFILWEITEKTTNSFAKKKKKITTA